MVCKMSAHHASKCCCVEVVGQLDDEVECIATARLQQSRHIDIRGRVGVVWKKATVEAALRRLIESHERLKAFMSLHGIGWDGDLDEMRGGHNIRPGRDLYESERERVRSHFTCGISIMLAPPLCLAWARTEFNLGLAKICSEEA